MQLIGERADDGWLSAYARQEASRLALRRARDEAAAARLDAKEARQAKAAFLSGLNHELRTPLNAITGFTGLLRQTLDQDIPNDKKAEYLDHVLQSAGVLLERIDAILEAANRSGAPGSAKGPADVVPVLRRLIQEHTGTLFVAKVDIDNDLPQARLASRDLYTAFQGVFSALICEGAERQPIGLTARAAEGDAIEAGFVLLTAAPHVDDTALRPVASQLARHGIGLTVDRDTQGCLTVKVRIEGTREDLSP